MIINLNEVKTLKKRVTKNDYNLIFHYSPSTTLTAPDKKICLLL